MVDLVIDTHMKSAHTTYPIYVKKVNKIKIKIYFRTLTETVSVISLTNRTWGFINRDIT